MVHEFTKTTFTDVLCRYDGSWISQVHLLARHFKGKSHYMMAQGLLRPFESNTQTQLLSHQGDEWGCAYTANQ